MFAIRPFGIKILNFKSVQLNWLKKELIPPLKSMIVIDVNQINNCIEYEAEFCWISPKPKNQINNCIEFEYEAEFSWISPKPWYHVCVPTRVRESP